MADVRSLLRQQRAVRRIEHAYAAYSDAGKLLCTLCHEHIKAESLWDGHLRGAGHRQRVKALQERAQAKPDGGELETASAQAQSHKRKLDEDRDEEMADIPEAEEEEEPMRKKRSRPDMTVSISAEPVSPSDQRPSPHGSLSEGSGKKDEAARRMPNSLTPPMLQRRTSGTPVLGVEMQIPSRPATPIGPTRDGMGGSGSASAASASALSTPKMQPPGKSPLIPSNAGFVAGNGAAATQETGSSAAGPLAQGPVDEDEWAAFEADMLGGQAPGARGAAPVSADAVISAAAMTAEQLAAKGAEEDQEKRKALADIELEDEKEEATRALEDEFEEMEELEARVQKLKERREALRQKPGSGGETAASARVLDPKEQSAQAGKENAAGDGAVQDQDEDDDEDEDEDEDDWAGFRFRG